MTRRAAALMLMTSLCGCGSGTTTLDLQSAFGRRDAGPPSTTGECAGPGCPQTVPAETRLGSAPLRRLTRAQYIRTMSLLLKLPEGAQAPVSDLPADLSGPEGAGFSFSNFAPLNGISSSGQVDAYRKAANQWVNGVFAAGQELRRLDLVGCDASVTNVDDRQACVLQFIQTFGRRAFRRSLTAEEVQTYATLAQGAFDDQDRWRPVRLVMKAMLQSPNFLFIVEHGLPDPERPHLLRLTGLERATRLSFGLLGRGPDDGLLAAAERGELDTPEGVRTHALLLLSKEGDEARAREALWAFATELLQLQHLDHLTRDVAEFPAWTEQLREDMAEESRRTFEALAFGDGADFLDFLTTRESFLTPELARLYGVAEPSARWQKVALPPERAGVLTQAAFLTATSRNGNDPIHRGHVITGQLFCYRLKIPDAVPEPPASGPPRVRFAQHRSDKACASCHTHLDGVGIALEQFDGIGAHRLSADYEGYPDYPLTGEAEYAAFSPPQFRGGVELAQRVRSSPELVPCLVRQVFRYQTGRLESDTGEGPLLDALVEAFVSSGHSYRALLIAFVQSDAFLFRANDPSASNP